MDAREAIRKAKQWIQEVYSDESIQNVGLEEVRKAGGDWLITIGFSRPWDKPSSFGIAVVGDITRRSYKTVRLNDDSGEVISSEIREPAG